MKNDYSFKFAAGAILAGVILAFINPAEAADGARAQRSKASSGTYENTTGKTGTFTRTSTRGGGQLHRDGTWTNQDGQTGTRTFDRALDKTTGTGTVSASTTGVNGNTRSRAGTLSKNADGSVSSQGTVTGSNGKTGTYAGTTVKTATGSTTFGTISGPAGKTASYESATSKIATGEVSRTTTTTGPNGKTSERVTGTKMNGDGTGTRTVEVTKPDGTTETRTETFTVASPAAVP